MITKPAYQIAISVLLISTLSLTGCANTPRQPIPLISDCPVLKPLPSYARQIKSPESFLESVQTDLSKDTPDIQNWLTKGQTQQEGASPAKAGTNQGHPG